MLLFVMENLFRVALTKIMDTGSRGLIHMIFNDFGHEVCQKFLDDMQNIVTRYLVLSGFSVGISDLIADRNTNEKIRQIIVKKKKDVSKLVSPGSSTDFRRIMVLILSCLNLRNQLINYLHKAIAEAGKIGLKSLSKDNRMANMVSSGSKGKAINIAQMVACLGQQNVDGKRIPNGYNERSLPHFTKYNVSPEARGFVENSFINGLSPQEFFFHAGGREGLIDTAVKTSETGYIQRKLIKAMEDLKVKHDLSVVNAGGNIIQFLYGEDGMDYIKIENQPLEHFNSNFAKLERDHKFAGNEDFTVFLTGKVIKEMKSNKKYKNILNDFFNEVTDDYHLRSYIFKDYRDNNVTYPVNLIRLIADTKTRFDIHSNMLSDLNPLYIVEKINALVKTLRLDNTLNGMKLFYILRANLSPVVLKHHRLNRIALNILLQQLKHFSMNHLFK